MSAVAQRLVRPLGGWLSVLVWRLLGLALVIVWSQSVRPTWAEGLAKTPMGFDAVAIAGVLLALAGPSLAVLALSCGAGLWFLYEILIAGTMTFIADEYIVHAGVPILGFGLTLAALIQQRGASEDDQGAWIELAHLRLFRVTVVTTLLLAGLHKLNSGFFNPQVSCAALGARLSEWWALPAALHGSPASVVALELACPIALCCYPRLGVVLVVLAMAAMAHIGPAGFATTLVVLSVAFLSPADRRSVAGLMGRHGLVIALATTFVLLLGFTRYTGPNPWFRFGVFEAVAVVVLVLATRIGLQRARWRLRHGGWRALVQPAFVEWRRHAPRRAWPGLTSWLVLLALVNGLSPYIGFKHRFAVAMLSNLRADDGQWNSYVIPAWVDLRAHDGFIHARWQPVVEDPRRRPALDGVYQRDSFVEQLEGLMRTQARGTLVVRHAGETVEFELPQAYLEVRAWAANKPQSQMAQDRLTPGDEPQHCIH